MKKLYPLLFSFLFFQGFSQPSISYQSFLSGFTALIEVVNAGDGSNRLFMVQQDGIIRVYDPAAGGLQANPFLDISGLVRFSGEQGLLSMAFHPNYENNGYFFVYYNNTAGNIALARYAVSVNANEANGSSGVVLLTINKTRTNHNGAHLQFGKDGHLYFATGDSGGANDPDNRAQDSTSLLGKMIRLNVDNFTTAPYYTVPSSNPFAGSSVVDNRIWAFGLRNPFRWSFDRLTGDMWIGDVGQGAREEINFRPASSTGGENYGWRCYEGSIRNPNLPDCNPPNYVPPVFDYTNSGGGASVVGGYVYRGTEYPVFAGWYIATDAYSNTIYLIKPDGSGGWTVLQQAGTVGFVVSFGEGEDGTLYAASRGTNTVYKIVATDISLPLVLQQFSATAQSNGTLLKWTTAGEEPGTSFLVQYSSDGSRFDVAGEVAATGNTGGATYTFLHPLTAGGPLFYRLLIREDGSGSRYSETVKIPGRAASVQVYPTVIRDGSFTVRSNGGLKQVTVLNSNGLLILKKRVTQTGSSTVVQLPPLAGGVYFVLVETAGGSSRQRVVVK